MTISFLTPNNDRGICVYSRRLVDELVKFGDQVHINVVEFEIVEKSWKLKDIFYLRKYFSKIGDKLNANADLVHIQHEYSLFGIWTVPYRNMYKILRKRINTLIVLTVHELEERKKGKTLLRSIIKVPYYIIFKRYLRYVNFGMFEDCQGIIVHSKKMKQTLIDRGIFPHKIFVIPHPIYNIKKEEKCSADDIAKLRKKLKVDGKFVLTTFGSINERKGQDLMISTLKLMDKNIVYLIAGEADRKDSKYMLKLEKIIRKNKLHNRVLFTGYVKDSEIKEIMGITDLIIYPARDTSASGSIAEAIAYKKAILASQSAYVREINEEVDCIETCEFKDKNEIERSVHKFYLNKSYRKEFEKATVRLAKKRSYANIALKTLEIYSRVISNN